MEKFAPLNLSPEELTAYTPEWQGERFADGRPRVSNEIETDFSRWLEDHIDDLPVPRDAIQELLKERTW